MFGATFNFVALVAIFVLCSSTASKAIDLYVSTTGNDTNPGTLSQPFLTIPHGITQLAPGTTLWILPGTYFYPQELAIGVAGTSTAPITISGMPNQPRPIIDGRLLPFGGAHGSLLAIIAPYVNVQRLSLRNAPWPGHCLALDYAAYADISENEMTGCGVNGLWMGNGTSVAIHDNWIHHNDVINQYRNASNWGQGLGIDNCLGCVLERNLIEENYGEGLTVHKVYQWQHGCIVQANTLLDNWSVGLYLIHASNTLVQRNFVRLVNAGFFRSGYPATGLSITDETQANVTSIRSTNNTWVNNIVVGASSGWYGGAFTSDASLALGPSHAQVYYNTFSESVLTGVTIQQAPLNGEAGNIFSSNFFSMTPTAGTFTYINSSNNYVPKAGVIEFHYNAFWNSSATKLGVIGDYVVTDNPMLLALNGEESLDFFPQANSSLLGSGDPSTAPSDDFFGQPRTGSPDIGAIQTTLANAHVFNLTLPPNVTDPVRVFTLWNFGDGSPLLSTVGVFTSHLYINPGSYSMNATTYDPTVGQSYVTTETINVGQSSSASRLVGALWLFQ